MAVISKLQERKDTLANIRSRATELIERDGARGSQVSTFLSEKLDELLTEILDSALATLPEAAQQRILREACVVAVGGTGRKEPVLHSDVDLMFLFQPRAEEFVEFTSGVVRDMWDTGIKLGHSLHTPTSALKTARAEIQFSTSLCEARLLWGGKDFFEGFRQTLRRKFFIPYTKKFVLECISARTDEAAEHGGTTRQLEPDLKKSLGGLRDVHLIRWVGFAVYDCSDINSLRMAGVLPPTDSRRLLAAWEFLMQIRMELHIHAGRPMDVLTRDDQLWLARKRGIQDKDGQRDVEILMQQFFQHTGAIAEIAEHFVKRNIPGSRLQNLIARMTARRLDEIFIVSRLGVDIVAAQRKNVFENLEQIMRLFRTAHLSNMSLIPEIADVLRERDIDSNVTKEVGRVFRQVLRGGGPLGQTLRSMYHTRVLDALIPEISHIRGLLQFNQYHHYTVDEHTLRAIEAIRRFEFDDGQLGSAYRHVRHKATLHLAMLLHDIGKGYDEDHSEVGARISLDVAQRLNMTEHKTDMLHFLVLKHLRMAHVAFRRDITDTNLLVEFAHEVGSSERLRMLYVLTAADIQAVGPGAWTEWKAELLTDLYHRAMQILSGKPVNFLEEDTVTKVGERVRQLTSGEETAAVMELLPLLPAHYLVDEDAQDIVSDLRIVNQLADEDIRISTRYISETDVVDYRIIVSGPAAKGCFHKIAGVLTALRMQILVARIATTSTGIAVDSFRVRDHDFTGKVPQERMDNVAELLKSALQNTRSVESLFQARQQSFQRKGPPAKLFSNLETRVLVDNDSSRTHTVIDVFAHDQPGLLFVVTRAIFRMGLSVAMAKISTHLDQVVDVFYVTDAHGNKLPDSTYLGDIKNALLEELHTFEHGTDWSEAPPNTNSA